jgi:hypothetical protein
MSTPSDNAGFPTALQVKTRDPKSTPAQITNSATFTLNSPLSPSYGTSGQIFQDLSENLPLALIKIEGELACLWAMGRLALARLP